MPWTCPRCQTVHSDAVASCGCAPGGFSASSSAAHLDTGGLEAEIARLREERDAAIEGRQEWFDKAGERSEIIRRLEQERDAALKERDYYQTKAKCYGDMVNGCSPALEAAGYPVDATGEDGAVGGVRRAVEALRAALVAAQDREGRLNSVHIDVCEKLKHAQDRERDLRRAAQLAFEDLEQYEWIDLPDGYCVKATVDALRAALSPAAAPSEEAEACLICGKPVPGYVAEMCCDGMECGCRGQPINPCVCPGRCEKALFGGIGKPMEQRRIDAGIEKWEPAAAPPPEEPEEE